LIRFYFLIFFCFAVLKFQAQEVVKKDSLKKKNRFIEFLTKKRTFLVAPQLARSPETGILTGLYYLKLFKNLKDTNTRTSNIETFLSVTQKKQYFFRFNETILFDKERFILRGTSNIARYNEYFYGIGNNIDLKQKDTIELNFAYTTQRLTGKIARGCFLGLQYQFYKTLNIGYIQNDILDKTANALGKNGSLTSGIGPVFLYDTRDHVIYSRTGSYLDASALFVKKFLGSNFEYTNITIDARKFIKFYKNYVLCFQGLLNYNVGNVPFRQLALMGGDVIMRGYYLGSYRDKVMTCAQVELRLPIYKFFGIVLFAAAGEVQSKLSAFNSNDIRYTAGMGLRFMFIKHERVNVGADVGFGKKTKGLYFGSGESF